MILICGGAGYIGSHTNKLLSEKGYETVVFDNLVYGHRDAVKWGHFIEGDLADNETVAKIFRDYPIDAVMHFSAYAYVGESVIEPAKYYRNNVVCTMNLLDEMRNAGCNKIIFSSTCATYGTPASVPITEDMPQNPINPYGYSKLFVERILKDYSAAYGLKFVSLRYFNAAGADPDGELGERHDPETHLIPLIFNAALNKSEGIRVFGNDYPTPDGTCIRDYIHVWDLAAAHQQALDYLQKGGGSDCFNLGNSKGVSVMEVIEAVKRVTGKNINVIAAERRAGDPPALVGSADKAKSILGWHPEYEDIDTIVKHAWSFCEKMD